MFTIISIMFTGIGIGYLLRDLRFFAKSREKYFSYHIPVAFCSGAFNRFQ